MEAAKILWTLAGVTLLALAISAWMMLERLDDQERRTALLASSAVDRADRAEAAWNRWNGRQPPSAEMWPYPPLDSDAGRKLVRYALDTRDAPSMAFWQQVSTLPALLRSWYGDSELESLSRSELSLLAWARLPREQLKRAGVDSSLASTIALFPDLEKAVAERCPTGCPPLTEKGTRDIRGELVSLLDSDDPQLALAALQLLARSGQESAPLLEERFERGSPVHGRALTFIALMRVLPLEERRPWIRQAQTEDDPGIRALGKLESLRALEPKLLLEARDSGADSEFPGLDVLDEYVRNILISL